MSEHKKKLTVCKVENLIDLEVGFVTNQYCSQCDRVCVLSRRWCRLQFASNTNRVLKEPGASFMQHSLGWMFTNSALLCMQSCGSDPFIDFSSRMRVYVCVWDGVENKCMPTSRYWPKEDWGGGREGKGRSCFGIGRSLRLCVRTARKDRDAGSAAHRLFCWKLGDVFRHQRCDVEASSLVAQFGWHQILAQHLFSPTNTSESISVSGGLNATNILDGGTSKYVFIPEYTV